MFPIWIFYNGKNKTARFFFLSPCVQMFQVADRQRFWNLSDNNDTGKNFLVPITNIINFGKHYFGTCPASVG